METKLERKNKENTIDKRKNDIITQWLYNLINDRTIADYFSRHTEIKNIVIYGIGLLGELFYDDVSRHTDMEVKYIIDKNADSMYYGIENIDICSLAEASQKECPDTIVVTPMSGWKEIKRELQQIYQENIRIIFLEDIIYEVE